MNKRQFLSAAVVTLFSILLIGFAWVLLSGINTIDDQPFPDTKINNQHKLFKGLKTGQVVLRQYQRQAVWVLHLSSQQQTQVKQLDGYVDDGDVVACAAGNTFCVLIAATERSGIHIQYTQQAPAQLPVDTPWFGGFVDPTNGAFYDFLGRAYDDQEHQKSMLSIPVDSLN